MLIKENLHQIGRLAKPHGRKGEIELTTDYDLSNFAEDGEGYLICIMDGLPVPFFIESYRKKNDTTALVRFADIDAEEKIKVFIGKPVYLPIDMLNPLDDDRPEWEQFIGYLVIDEVTGGALGEINGVDSQTINVLFRIDYTGKEQLIPVAFMTGYDPEIKEVTVALPDGFLELYNDTH